ncbi:MAG: hypothetical protein D4R67_02320 [Bacteroidetes bacterium]|nr:MAG: hypothetical protein D4R67_02320 [Bacteroidota bacterium]
MKFRNLFWALILIAIGLVFLFSNFGWLNFHWISIWRLWRLIYNYWGISILPIKDVIKFILVIAFLAITFIFFNQITEPRWSFTIHDHDWSWADKWDEDDSGRTYTFSTQVLSVPMDSAATKGVLKMDAAAGKFYINGETSEMLSFKKEGDIGDYSITTEEVDGKTVIHISLEKNPRVRRVKKNTVDIQLNKKLVWDLDFDIGAAAVKMDLSDYKIDTANIDAGAASLEIKLGALQPRTYMTYSAGAASLEVKIPKESACEIHSESVLVSRDFEGFVKKGDGVYQTANYPEGSNVIILKIESAVSSLKVDRY